MRIEERFNEFVRTLKSAEIVDEMELTPEQMNAKKPDFFFNERQLIGEMKTVAKDMMPKVEAILEKHRNRPEYPVFYSEWEVSKILSHLPDGEEINSEIFHVITSAIEDGVEKANRQIRTAKTVFALNESEGILIVLNDSIDVMSPDIVAHKIAALFKKRTQSGEPRYPHVSRAWVISDIHVFQEYQEQKLLPSIVVVNDQASSWEESDNYLVWIQRKWASFNNMPFIQGDSDVEKLRFKKREDENPSGMIRRSEMWRKQYQKSSYLRNLSHEALLEHGKNISSHMLSESIQGSHERPTSEVIHTWEMVTHFMEEMDYRGIDYRDFASKLDEACQELQQEPIDSN
jgi:hypothetical protein